MPARNEKWMIDSIEEGIAAITKNDGTVLHVPLVLLPADVHEGQICAVTIEHKPRESTLITTIVIDKVATRAAMDRSAAQIAATPKSNDPGGPIRL